MSKLAFASLAITLGVIATATRTIGAQMSSACPSTGPRPSWNVPMTVGASVAVLDSTSLTRGGGHTLSEALTARISGVSVLRSSGIAGAGSRVRFRGPSGLLTPQQPLLYIDGVRADGEQQSITVSTGQAPSRLDDVDLEAVECIVVLRGPAAAARHGTDAAGGVIHVITRSPSPETARSSAFVEVGVTADATEYPANFGTDPPCTQADATLGQCTIGAIRSWSPLEEDSPFRTAPRFRAGGSLALLRTPTASLAMNASGIVNDGAFRRNTDRRWSAGVAARYQPATSLSVRGNLWMHAGRVDIPGAIGDELNLNQILYAGLMGATADDERRGYLDFALSDLEDFSTEQRFRRLGGAVDVRWSPRSWLSLSATVGREDSHAQDDRAESIPSISQFPGEADTLTAVYDGDLRIQQNSATVFTTATYGPARLRLTSEIGLDYVAIVRRAEYSRVVRRGQVGSSLETLRMPDATTKGVIARQALVSSDRRFLEVGIRRDFLDRTTVRVDDPTYRFASAGWDMAREFLDSASFVSTLRLHTAYGEAGDSRQYEAFNPFEFFVPEPGRPPRTEWVVERSRETEGGVDVGLLSDRVVVQATYFSKRTNDGLIDPPFVGSLLATTGEWRTSGVEIMADTRLLESRRFRADLRVAFTSIDNELTDLGKFMPPFRVGFVNAVEPGQPLFGFSARRLRFDDANGDGVIVPAETSADLEPSFLGTPFPTRELGLEPSLTFGRTLTIRALIDHRGGFESANLTGLMRCELQCPSVVLPNMPLAEQARSVGLVRTFAGWVEDASFTRLREVNVTWTPPERWARRVGARTVSLTLGARNLATWTSYSGLDPEVTSTGQSSYLQEDFFTLPLPRTFLVRLDLRP